MKPKYFLFLILILFGVISNVNSATTIASTDQTSSSYVILDESIGSESILYMLGTYSWEASSPIVVGVTNNRIYFMTSTDLIRFCNCISAYYKTQAFNGEFTAYKNGNKFDYTLVGGSIDRYSTGELSYSANIQTAKDVYILYNGYGRTGTDWAYYNLTVNDNLVVYTSSSSKNTVVVSSDSILDVTLRITARGSVWSRGYLYVTIVIPDSITDNTFTILKEPPELFPLTINSNVDGFDIYENDKLLGTFDSGQHIDLVAGSHTLLFEKYGYLDTQKVVTIPDTESIDVEIRKAGLDDAPVLEDDLVNYFIEFKKEQDYDNLSLQLENLEWEEYEPVITSVTSTRLEFETAKDLARFICPPTYGSEPFLNRQYTVFYEKKIADVTLLDYRVNYTSPQEIYKIISFSDESNGYVYGSFVNLENRTIKIAETNTTEDENSLFLETAVNNDSLNVSYFGNFNNYDSLYFKTNSSVISKIDGRGTVVIFKDVDVYETGHEPFIFDSESVIYPKYNIIFVTNVNSILGFDQTLSLLEGGSLENYELPAIYLGLINNGDKITLPAGLHEFNLYKDGYIPYTLTINLQSDTTIDIEMIETISAEPASTVSISEDVNLETFTVTITEPAIDDSYYITFKTLYNGTVKEKKYTFLDLDSNTQIIYNYSKLFVDLGIAETVENETVVPEGNYVINVEIKKNEDIVSNKNFLIIISPPPERTFTTLLIISLMLGVISYVIIAPFSKNAPFSFILAGLTVGVFQEVFQIGTLGKITAGLFFALSVLTFIFSEFKKRG